MTEPVINDPTKGKNKSIFSNSSTNPGAFNINTFMSDIRTRGVVRSNAFMVNIVPPKILRSKWPTGKNLIIRCDSASLPAVNLQMGELFRHGFGAQESSPHNVQFEPVNLSFILDMAGEVYNFWYSWMNGIMNFNRSKGLNTKDEYGKLPYEMAYKDDYASEIKVIMYNEASDTILQSTMTKAFPMGINDTPLSWGNTDDIVRLNIPISYRDFYTNVAQQSTADNLHSLLSETVPNQSFDKNGIKDQFSIFGLNSPLLKTSKLDTLITEVLLK